MSESLEALKAVLLGPDDEVSISGSDEDREIVKESLAEIEKQLDLFTLARLETLRANRTIDDLATQFVEDLTFEALLIWADTLGVFHDEKTWFGDTGLEKDNELRIAVAEAMAKLGRAK